MNSRVASKYLSCVRGLKSRSRMSSLIRARQFCNVILGLSSKAPRLRVDGRGEGSRSERAASRDGLDYALAHCYERRSGAAALCAASFNKGMEQTALRAAAHP